MSSLHLVCAFVSEACFSSWQGNVVRGEGHPEATAFWIHSRVHEVHPAAGCVVHTHQTWTTALTCLTDPT